MDIEKMKQLREEYHKEKPQIGDIYIGPEKGAVYDVEKEGLGEARFKGGLKTVEDIEKNEEEINETLSRGEEFLLKKENMLQEGFETDNSYADLIDESLGELREMQGDLEEFRDGLIDRKATFQLYDRTLAREYMRILDSQLKKTDDLIERAKSDVRMFQEEKTKHIIG